MQATELHVRHVVGRYPRGGALKSENAEVQVYEVARVFRIRIDDAQHPGMWMELVVEVETGVPAEPVRPAG
jgi:hypothetical protein